MPSTLRQRFAAVLFITLMAVLLPRAAHAFTETNNLPKPHWISAPPTSSDQPRIEISREFTAPTNLLRAVLLLAGESNCVAQLNGPAPLAAVGRDRAAGFDVTQRIRPGTNRISIIDPRGFPQPTAAALELSHGDGTVTWIVTDTNWVANGSGAAPTAAISGGLTSANPATDPFDPARAFDAYNSWRLAKGANQATPANELTLLPGFTAELIRSAQPGEDSWISLAFDPQGRLTIGKEKKGLLRFTLTNQTVAKVETINDTLLECRGLLYAHGALYAMANNTKALVRLRDTNGDDRFDEIRELIRTEGGVGHGRNHVKLGPDGKLYLIHGDDVKLPPNVVSHCPPNFFQPDQLITAAWDEPLEQQRARMPLGHLLRCDSDGGNIEMICGGLRNPLDIAFNERGDIFTYDADNERDIGTPWYRPTRVLHLVSGGDYGWRRSTATWPEFRPDGLPAAVNIGVGSPTAVEFGTRSNFPERYRRALFIGDWAYGRIIAVHLTAQGTSYTGTHENFVTGRPLNVTDLAFGPDGAMYFTTGGRQTQSGLYRVVYREKSTPKLERLASTTPASQVGRRWAQYAERVGLEKRPDHEWQSNTLPSARLGDLLAVARTGSAKLRQPLLERLASRNWNSLDEEEQLTWLRIHALLLVRSGPASASERDTLLNRLTPLFPATNFPLNHELVELLAFLQSPQVVAKTLPLMQQTSSSAELLRYLYCLRVVKSGWTLEQRRQFLTQLTRAEAMQGAREYYRSLTNIRTEFIASLNTSERLALRSLLEPKRTATGSAAPSTFVRAWTLDDLLPHLDQVGRGRSASGGREAFASAQCLACHRLGNDGGVLGPDLTSVSSRFGRRDVLEHILKPSLAIDEKFRQTRVRRRDGESVTGTLESDSGSELVLRPALLSEETVRVPTADIASREESELSPMPEDLLNGLRLEQILDLLAWLESGGNEKHAAFRK